MQDLHWADGRLEPHDPAIEPSGPRRDEADLATGQFGKECQSSPVTGLRVAEVDERVITVQRVPEESFPPWRRLLQADNVRAGLTNNLPRQVRARAASSRCMLADGNAGRRQFGLLH